MKKYFIKAIALFLALITVFPLASFCISAENIESETEAFIENTDESTSAESDSDVSEETEQGETEANTENTDGDLPVVNLEDALEFSCYYDVETHKVNVKGTMNYDSFSEHADSTLLIYSIPPGKTENQIINSKSVKPIAEAPVSITFAFSFKINKLIDRYSKYAIFLKSEKGEYTLTTEAQFAEIRTSVNEKTKDSFKGVLGSYSHPISNVNPNTVTIPVYLDAIVESSPNAYIYQIEHKQYSFNKAYVDSLDAQIRSLSLFGTKVYLQYLLRPSATFKTPSMETADYFMPDAFDSGNIMLLHSITDFIASRYNDASHGNIAGIVVGKNWDNVTTDNAFNITTLSGYADNCVQYTAIIANSARSVLPDLEIKIPISGNSFYADVAEEQNYLKVISAKEFLPILMEEFDSSTYSGLDFSFFVEAETTPLDITEENIKDGIDVKKEQSEDAFYIGNQSEVSEYLLMLSQKYKSGSKHYSVLWSPKQTLRGNAFCAAYAYAFFSLLVDESVINFTINQESCSEAGFTELSYIIKNIDVSKNYSATDNVLTLFGASSWAEVLGISALPTQRSNVRYNKSVLPSLPQNIKGEFCYFDFSRAFLADSWLKGIGCSDIKIDYTKDDKKAFRSDFLLQDDFGEIIYSYEYPENISYTPYLKIKFEIISDSDAPLYEMRYVFNTETSFYESKTIVNGNELNETVLDLSSTEGFSALKSVKFSIRSLDDTANSCSMWIYDIIGYSTVYTNEELEAFVAEERDKNKSDVSESSEKDKLKKLIFILIIITVSALLGFALVLILQRNSRRKRE